MNKENNKTHRKTPNPMTEQPKKTEKLLSVMSGSGARFCPRY